MPFAPMTATCHPSRIPCAVAVISIGADCAMPEIGAYSIVCDEMRSAVSCVDPRRGDSVSLGRVFGMSDVAQCNGFD